jgi:dihydrofolate reductase
MKLITNTQVSVDGVVQGNGGRHPILDPGFERGGWARPLFDDEAMKFVEQAYGRADAFLFGRRTYDLFAGYWGVRKDLESPIVGALNVRPRRSPSGRRRGVRLVAVLRELMGKHDVSAA